jgi:anaerobic magnesium-protoporphyrin IX monomethyl ester cyclase
MNFTMILPNIRTDIYVHLGDIIEGVAYLSSALEQKGIRFNLIRVLQPADIKELIKRVKETSPDIIGFSSISPMFKYVKQWAPLIKNAIEAFTICGGVHPTLDPEGTLSIDGIDGICIGEGENALVELCSKIQQGNTFLDTKSFWFKKNGKVIKNPIRPLPENLDHLPFPNLDIFDYTNSFYYRNHLASMRVSRGCIFNCYYCCNHILKRRYPNQKNYVRHYSVQGAIKYIQTFLKKYPDVDVIDFNDDVLTLDNEWLEEFVIRYKREVGLPFSCRDRLELLTEEKLEKLRYGRCFRVIVGIESGNEEIRYNVLNRKMSEDLINKSLERCQRLGIKVQTYNMFGLPTETMKKALDTIKINTAPAIDRPMSFIFYPYFATELYNRCFNEGLMSSKELESYREDTILNLKSIKKNQVRFLHFYFPKLVKLYVYLRNKPRLRNLVDSIMCSKLFPNWLFLLAYKLYTPIDRYRFIRRFKKGRTSKTYLSSALL